MPVPLPVDMLKLKLSKAHVDEGVAVAQLTGYRYVGSGNRIVILWTDTPHENVIITSF